MQQRMQSSKIEMYVTAHVTGHQSNSHSGQVVNQLPVVGVIIQETKAVLVAH